MCLYVANKCSQPVAAGCSSNGSFFAVASRSTGRSIDRLRCRAVSPRQSVVRRCLATTDRAVLIALCSRLWRPPPPPFHPLYPTPTHKRFAHFCRPIVHGLLSPTQFRLFGSTAPHRGLAISLQNKNTFIYSISIIFILGETSV